MIIVTAVFKSWLKASTNMKLSYDASVNRVIHEGVTDFNSLIDFDKDTIQYLPKVCKESIAAIPAGPVNNITAEAEVPGASVSSITIQRLRGPTRYKLCLIFPHFHNFNFSKIKN